MRITVESAEVATLKPDGRPWDGPGGPRVPKAELETFFSLSLTAQLERLASSGEVPNPPDVFVRIYRGEELLFESSERETYEPEWSDDAKETALKAGDAIKVQVWDRDLVFHDLIGEKLLFLPAPEGDGLWRIAPFGQVRRLVIKLG